MKDNVFVLAGTNFERGVAHGKHFANEIHHSLKLFHDQCATGPTDHTIREYVTENTALLSKYCPDLLDEIQGLAEGAGITLADAVLLQNKRELLKSKYFLDCSTIARHKTDGGMVAQTIDLTPALAAYPIILKIIHNTGTIKMFSFAGLLGYLGMNDSLLVGINMVLSSNWSNGISPYLLVRHILQHCRSVDDAVAFLRSVPRGSSRCLTILDRQKLVFVEFDSNHLDVVDSSVVDHTNHFVSPGMKKEEKLHPFVLSSSMKRLSRLTTLVGQCDPYDAHAVFKGVFSDHDRGPISSICAHSDHSSKPSTVGAVHMSLGGSFSYVIGNTCINKFEEC